MSKICDILHKELNKLERFSFPIDKNKIFSNGIYVLFEKDEKGHSGDRIVRIGTHTGSNKLFSRLKEHFQTENKDRSIFRKNIGRCMLNKENSEYLKVWEIDFTTKKAREEFSIVRNLKFEKEIEEEISKYLIENFSFSIIEINDKDERLFYESRLISTVSKCIECSASDKWLGNFSTKSKIRESGLYLVNELYKSEFDETELNIFMNKYIKKNS